MRAAGLTVAAVVGLFGGRWGLLIVATVLALLATGEVLRLVRASGVQPAAAVALAGTVMLLLLSHLRGERGPRLAPAVIAAVLGLAFGALLVRRNRANVPRAVAATLIPVLTVGLLASFIVALRNMPDGFRLTIVLVGMVVAAEALPALGLALRNRSGRVGGWRRLIVGEIGALFVVLVAGLAFPETFTWPDLIVLGLLVGTAAPVGHLAADMMEADLVAAAAGERRAPAGSLLVRLDGLLLAAPVFFYVFRALTR